MPTRQSPGSGVLWTLPHKMVNLTTVETAVFSAVSVFFFCFTKLCMPQLHGLGNGVGLRCAALCLQGCPIVEEVIKANG